MRTPLKITAYACLASLSACASIIEGGTDKINIATVPATNATCTLSNSRGSYDTYTPTSVSVKKSRSDLNIACADPRSGAKGQSTVASEVEPWAFGNILIGGLIGLGVDWTTGAAYNYPESASVPMTMPVAVAPTPTEAQPGVIYYPAAGVAPATTTPAPAPMATPAVSSQAVPPAPVQNYQPVAPAPQIVVPAPAPAYTPAPAYAPYAPAAR